MIPISIAKVKPRSPEPPQMYIISTTMNVVNEVSSVRDSVWLILVVDHLRCQDIELAAVFTNAVKDNDCIVQRVPDNRQERGDHFQVDLEVGNQQGFAESRAVR